MSGSAHTTAACLFASDLHLSLERPAKLRQFEQLLDYAARRVAQLYLLGDLVEAWLGDDDDRPPNDLLVRGLTALVECGVGVTVVHGNRDFLMGEHFVARTGVRLVPEQAVITLFGRPALIMHGDSLCTRDVAYQHIRRQLRSPEWQTQVLGLSLQERIALASQMRTTSLAMSAEKDHDIMDVSPEAVVAVMQAAGVDLLIHGHTHRPGRHGLSLAGRTAERIVLGDWYDTQDSVLHAAAGVLELLPVTQLLDAP